MKTKAKVKKSRSQGVKKSRADYESKSEPQPATRLLTPRPPNFSTLRATKVTEQTGNVYENKGASQEVEEPGSREAESRKQIRAAVGDAFVNSSTARLLKGPDWLHGTAVNCSTPRLLDFPCFEN